jgi:mortality factor 4-like protein 1
VQHTYVQRSDVFCEVIQGLELYFEKALGKLLLYRFERLQYTEFIHEHEDTSVCDVYGAEHLVRLFGIVLRHAILYTFCRLKKVKLPTLLAHTEIREEAMTLIVAHMEALLDYLAKKHALLFMPDYENATPEYCRMAL